MIVRGSALARARAARGQRGAAVMLVVLVLTMLMGIGLYAARSSQLSTSASGYDRQMTQTHYVTQFAILAAVNELNARSKAYVIQMQREPKDTLCMNGLLAANVPNYTCYRFGYADLQFMAGQPFMTTAIPGGGSSLGNVNLESDWLVEMTDLAPGPTAPSQDAGGTVGATMKVTLTATGQVRPISLGPVATQPSAASASIEVERAVVTFASGQ